MSHPNADHRRLAIIMYNRSRGLCGCGARTVEGERYCQRCMVTVPEADRKNRARKRAAGMCCACLVSRPERGRICNKCRARVKAAFEAKVKAGICPRCDDAPAVGHVLCPRHLAALCDEYKARSAARRKDGLCARCGKLPARVGRRLCPGCKTIQSEHARKPAYAAKRRAASLRPLNQAKAAARSKRLRTARLQQKICTECGAEPLYPGLTVCVEHRELNRIASAEKGKQLRADPAKHQKSKAWHAAWYRRKRDAREAAGLCLTCGKEQRRPRWKTCQRCSDRAKAKQAARSNHPHSPPAEGRVLARPSGPAAQRRRVCEAPGGRSAKPAQGSESK